MSIDAQMYDGSNTSLNQNIPTRETYNPNEILHVCTIPRADLTLFSINFFKQKDMATPKSKNSYINSFKLHV